MNRTAFFDSVRAAFGRLSQPQVDGFETILAATDDLPVTHRSYLLATAWHESAATMQPIKERGGPAYFRRMYDPQGERPNVAKRLGNTKPGDGARYAGRGYVQLTGRANYTKAGKALGVDLVGNPDLAMQPTIAAQCLVRGCEEGWFTGKRLADYLPGSYVDARRVVNGTDKADLIAGYARTFEAALGAGDTPAQKPVAPVPVRTPAPTPAPRPAISWWIAAWAGIVDFLTQKWRT